MKTNWLTLLLILTAGSVFAEVTRIRIDQREPFADGTRFGQAGAYESITGRLFSRSTRKTPSTSGCSFSNFV